jgi:plasmid stabilization system protein ParE
LIGFTPKAAQQLKALWRHYIDLERLDAVRKLSDAIDAAIAAIERDPIAGLAAPRPYPALAKPGRAWVKAGRYWILYSTTRPPIIMGVFFETANIPKRQPWYA